MEDSPSTKTRKKQKQFKKKRKKKTRKGWGRGEGKYPCCTHPTLPLLPSSRALKLHKHIITEFSGSSIIIMINYFCIKVICHFVDACVCVCVMVFFFFFFCVLGVGLKLEYYFCCCYCCCFNGVPEPQISPRLKGCPPVLLNSHTP